METDVDICAMRSNAHAPLLIAILLDWIILCIFHSPDVLDTMLYIFIAGFVVTGILMVEYLRVRDKLVEEAKGLFETIPPGLPTDEWARRYAARDQLEKDLEKKYGKNFRQVLDKP